MSSNIKIEDELPQEWSKKIWSKTNIINKKGKIKWITKKVVRVGEITLKPPQIQTTNLEPKIGITLNKLVITVQAQKDICPQGKT